MPCPLDDHAQKHLGKEADKHSDAQAAIDALFLESILAKQRASANSETKPPS